jgi:hypothetical protein
MLRDWVRLSIAQFPGSRDWKNPEEFDTASALFFLQSFSSGCNYGIV